MSLEVVGAYTCMVWNLYVIYYSMIIVMIGLELDCSQFCYMMPKNVGVPGYLLHSYFPKFWVLIYHRWEVSLPLFLKCWYIYSFASWQGDVSLELSFMTCISFLLDVCLGLSHLPIRLVSLVSFRHWQAAFLVIFCQGSFQACFRSENSFQDSKLGWYLVLLFSLGISAG